MNKTFRNVLSASAFAFFAFIAYGSMGDEKNDSNSSTTIGEDTSKITKTGEVLSTKYFDVTVNKISIEKSVNTGNQFADLHKEEGINYLIINTTFKNTSNESRMLTDGEVLINYNGKEYKFDKSETVMLDGWGLMLDQINPLTAKTTNLVYKIPSEITGVAYYRPGRSDKNDLIELGNIQ